MQWSNHMSEPKPQRVRRCGVFMALAAGMMCGGCQFYADPRSDDLADQPAVTTPSVESVRAAPVDRVPRKRPYAPMHISAKDGTVMHAALLFEDGAEDGAEDSADGDQRFAWSNEDLAQWFLGPARFLVNIGLFPISAVVTPPWQAMVSDGHSSPMVLGVEPHDAEPESTAAPD